MNITTLGVDLAKTSFSLVGMDKHGKQLTSKEGASRVLRRRKMTIWSDRGNESLGTWGVNKTV